MGKTVQASQEIALPSWAALLRHAGIKKVSRNDKAKGAFVPNLSQKFALAKAGAVAKDRKDISLTVLGEAEQTVTASYYLSLRNGRNEERLGKEVISTFSEKGDVILIGELRGDLYIANLSRSDHLTYAIVAQQLGELLAGQTQDVAELIAQAEARSAAPVRQATVRYEYARDPTIVAAALRRASQRCEWPECTSELFKKKSGDVYLEVHHIQPLSEGGFDDVWNTAALCPSCHRRLHHAADREIFRKSLADHLSAIRG